MLAKWSFTVVALCLFSALFIAARAASQSAQPEPAPRGAQQPASGAVGLCAEGYHAPRDA